MPTALIISFVEWAGAFQRPQHLALGLARRGWQVTYASPGYLHRKGARISSGVELPQNLNVVEPVALPGSGRLAIIATINQWLMRRSLHGLCEGLDQHASACSSLPPASAGGSEGIDDSNEARFSAASRSASARSPFAWDVVIFNDPRWAGLAAQIPARLRVFDCMDDLAALAPSAEWATKMEARALAAAGRVWTGTASLADRLAGRHASIRFIPCGVDSGRFGAPDADAIEAARADLPEGTGPLAGFFGVLNERVDMRRIEALMDSGPWRVLLIGPSTSRAPALPARPGLRAIGPRPYAQLPAYLAHFDLALIPYDTTGPHRFLYPVKALEYLAGSKPVLATPLPDIVRFLGEFVDLADSPADWKAAGRRLLETRTAALARARRGCDYARARSWEAMVDEMERDLRMGGKS